MDAPNLRWHDRSTADAERYELYVLPTIRAVVTRLRTATSGADYQAFFELQGKATPAPRPSPRARSRKSGRYAPSSGACLGTVRGSLNRPSGSPGGGIS